MPTPASKPELSLRNTLNNLRVQFGDLMGLPVDQRRVELLKRCQDVYDTALGKESLGKAGPFASPDCNAANKVIETVAKLTSVLDAPVPTDGGDGEVSKPTVAAITGAAERLEESRRTRAA